MSSKRNPWISIADLLSSVVLILLILFAIAALLPRYSVSARRAKMMSGLYKAMEKFEGSGLIKVDKEDRVLELTSMTFDRGSAILSSRTAPLVKELSGSLSAIMTESPNIEILIEGHTDMRPVESVANIGGYYENNIQLSTLRAASLRSALLAYLGDGFANRIGVAGYGETRPKKNISDPYSHEHRRVEVRILWSGRGDREFAVAK